MRSSFTVSFPGIKSLLNGMFFILPFPQLCPVTTKFIQGYPIDQLIISRLQIFEIPILSIFVKNINFLAFNNMPDVGFSA